MIILSYGQLFTNTSFQREEKNLNLSSLHAVLNEGISLSKYFKLNKSLQARLDQVPILEPITLKSDLQTLGHMSKPRALGTDNIGGSFPERKTTVISEEGILCQQK